MNQKEAKRKTLSSGIEPLTPRLTVIHSGINLIDALPTELREKSCHTRVCTREYNVLVARSETLLNEYV